MNLTTLSRVLNYTCICMHGAVHCACHINQEPIVFEGRAFFITANACSPTIVLIYTLCTSMQSQDCMRPIHGLYYKPRIQGLHRTIPGLRKSMLCTGQSLDCANPCFARNIYACRLIMLYNHTGTQLVFYFSLHELTTYNAKVTCMVFYRTHPNSWFPSPPA